jgi:MinD superfamily P-loop ATPase
MSGGFTRRAVLSGRVLGASPRQPRGAHLIARVDAVREVESLSSDTPRVAKIHVADCLAHVGVFCSTCVERCPVPGAILLDGQVPVVDASACDGCGQCAAMCPSPGRAIRWLPR